METSLFDLWDQFVGLLQKSVSLILSTIVSFECDSTN